jgi:outer membrane lipoprotein SlyB
MMNRCRRAVAVLTSAALLSACVSTRAGRIGADDGSDPCRTQVVALDSTGNFFGEDIIQGAAIGAVSGAVLGGLLAAASGRRGSDVLAGAGIGALAGGALGAAGGYYTARQRQATDQASLNRAIAGDLANENAQLDRTQLAFNQLMDCRFSTAQRIRADVRSGRLTRPQGEAMMANVRARTQNDIQLAQSINGQITTRGDQFDTAIEQVAPGTKNQVLAGARVSRPVPVQARATVPLKLRPDPSAPEVAQINPREQVTLQRASGGFALVETASGVRGYAPVSAFPEARSLPQAPSLQNASATDGDVRSLAASNIARRDNFTESVSNAERLAQGQGFELAAG